MKNDEAIQINFSGFEFATIKNKDQERFKRIMFPKLSKIIPYTDDYSEELTKSAKYFLEENHITIRKNENIRLATFFETFFEQYIKFNNTNSAGVADYDFFFQCLNDKTSGLYKSLQDNRNPFYSGGSPGNGYDNPFFTEQIDYECNKRINHLMKFFTQALKWSKENPIKIKEGENKTLWDFIIEDMMAQDSFGKKSFLHYLIIGNHDGDYEAQIYPDHLKKIIIENASKEQLLQTTNQNNIAKSPQLAPLDLAIMLGDVFSVQSILERAKELNILNEILNQKTADGKKPLDRIKEVEWKDVTPTIIEFHKLPKPSFFRKYSTEEIGLKCTQYDTYMKTEKFTSDKEITITELSSNTTLMAEFKTRKEKITTLIKQSEKDVQVEEEKLNQIKPQPQPPTSIIKPQPQFPYFPTPETINGRNYTLYKDPSDTENNTAFRTGQKVEIANNNDLDKIYYEAFAFSLKETNKNFKN